MEGHLLSDRYLIQRPLGHSGRPEAGQRTFLALDQQQREAVVIKLLQFGPGFEWDQLKLFQREAQILQSLDHPSIPHYLDSFDVDTPQCQGFALVQTYIEAPSLEEHLQSGRGFSVAEVKQLAQQLLKILSYLHSHTPPIVHRDLKPSNVLLRNRTAHSVGDAYLVDFGSVQNLVAARGGTMTVVGTYGYMPPEQFGGRAVPASDLYSLGATVIYLLSGIQPADLPQRDLRIQFEEHLPKDRPLQQWLRQMIEPALDRRYDSAAKALIALQEPATSNIMTQGKPLGSLLRLAIAGDRLRLIIPRPALGRSLRLPPLNAWGCVVAVVASWLWFLWLLLALGSRALWALFSLILEKQIIIDNESIEQSYWLCSRWVVAQKTIPRQAISSLEVVAAHKQTGNWGNTDVNAEIIIWAGNTPYHINTLSGLTPPEVRWLTEEMSEWLGVDPVNREILTVQRT